MNVDLIFTINHGIIPILIRPSWLCCLLLFVLCLPKPRFMSKMTSLSVSDILFPSQEDSLTSTNKSLNRILGDLKRSSLTITNRLRSIQQDADFVEGVRSAFSDDRLDQGGEQQQRRPLVANERCGSWYIRPEVKGGSAYFKSTDGHTGQWKFSTRRLNLHLLPLIERFDG